jgi:hypothetical protein
LSHVEGFAVFLEGFVVPLVEGFAVPFLEGFVVPYSGTFSSLKVVIVVGFYSLSFGQQLSVLLQPCLWSSPWQNCLPVLMIEIKTLEV